MTRRDDRRSPEAAAARRLYKTARWQRLRQMALNRDKGLCRYCNGQGRTVPAEVVDHIQPHRGDHARFYDLDNLQSLCRPHHDATKQAEERGGYVKGADVDGNPVDPGHPWRAERK